MPFLEAKTTVVPSRDRRKATVINRIEEVPFLYEENLIYFEGDKALEQAAQRENVESLPLDIFKSRLEGILL